MDWLNFFSKFIWPIIIIVIFLIVKNQIIGLLETLKEWQEFKSRGIEVKRQDRADTVNPPEPTGIKTPESIEDLSLEAKMVLSTLWKHQQEYYSDHTKGRWSFTVGTANPRNADYCIGVGLMFFRSFLD